MPSYNAVKREYASVLTFHDNTFYESVTDCNWTTYGGLEGISFSLEDSHFNDIAKCNNKVMSIFGPSSYLHNTSDVYVNGTGYTIAMWYNISSDAMSKFYADNKAFIPLVEWEDDSGMKCSIKIAAHDETTGNMCFRITYGTKTYDMGFPVYNEPDTWNHFMYTRFEDVDKFYINGSLIGEVNADPNEFNSLCFFNLKIGNPYNQFEAHGIFSYAIDDFVLCNDALYRDEFEVPTRFLAWIFPEIERIDELDGDDSIYKQGSMTGLKYIYSYPKYVGGSRLELETNTNTSNSMLFINSVYMAPDRWQITVTKIKSNPDVYKTYIQLNDAIDVSIASQSLFTLVTISQKVNEFHVEVRQVVAAKDGQRRFTIPYMKYQNTLESFILFDGSLAAIQQSRFKIEKVSDTQYDIILTNRMDYIATAGTPLTFVFLVRNSYDPAYPENDPLKNRQISFKRIQCIVTTKDKCILPKGGSKDYGTFGFGYNTALFFINGTFMTPDSFQIKKGVLTMNSPSYYDDTLSPNSNITILVMQSTEKPDYTDKEYIATGASDMDDLVNIRITRPVYWKEPVNPVHQMYDKLHFYEHNKVPGSNFNYVDKFHLRFKE